MIAQGMGDARSVARQGVPGGLVYADPTVRSRSGLNAGAVAQVARIVVDTATNSATYTWTINGVTLTYTADSSTSATEIGDGIVAAINAEPLARASVSAVNAAGTVTLTELVPGTAGAFTVSDSDAKLTTTESYVAASDAEALAFGVAVMRVGSNSNASRTETEDLIAAPTTARFTAQVATLSIAYVASAKITVAVYEVRDSEKVLLASVTETSATSQDATIDALIVSLNAQLPANSVLAAADSASATAVVFTAEIAGLEFEVQYSIGDEGASLPAVSLAATTGPSESTSLHRAFRGISRYSQQDPSSTIGGDTGSYAGNQGAEYLTRGVIWVSNSQSPTAGTPVYVELTAGASQGKLYNSSSSTRVALSRQRARWERAGSNSTDALAAVRLEA